MEIKKTINAHTMTIALSGRLDTLSSPQLQNELESYLAGISELVFDLSDLEYIASAGLRVLLSANKKLTAVNGTMTIKGANNIVKEVFDITGFSDIFTIL